MQIPATTSNVGPGFDCLGIALQLYNTACVEKLGVPAANSSMVREAGAAFFKTSKCKTFPFRATIQGDVPVSRGLGSSVTVRLGVIMGLNRLAGTPLKPQEILELVAQLEGHPDNATPAMLGGFTVCSNTRYLRVPVSGKLHFVALIPENGLETRRARAVLPSRVTLHEAVENQQRTALIAAAFCTGRYEALRESFQDHFHQPNRARLMPYLFPVIDAAEHAGALGAFLSGAGSTVMALTVRSPHKIGEAMLRTARRFRVQARIRVLKADNQGAQTVSSR